MDEGNQGMPKHGQFCWTEIAVGDLPAARTFFSNVFGWHMHESHDPNPAMEYQEYSVGGGYPMGGMYQIDPKFFGGNAPPPHFNNYIAVDDVDATAARAAELGATILNGPMDIPNVGRFAVVKDPVGAMFAIITLNEGGANG